MSSISVAPVPYDCYPRYSDHGKLTKLAEVSGEIFSRWSGAYDGLRDEVPSVASMLHSALDPNNLYPIKRLENSHEPHPDSEKPYSFGHCAAQVSQFFRSALPVTPALNFFLGSTYATLDDDDVAPGAEKWFSGEYGIVGSVLTDSSEIVKTLWNYPAAVIGVMAGGLFSGLIAVPQTALAMWRGTPFKNTALGIFPTFTAENIGAAVFFARFPVYVVLDVLVGLGRQASGLAGGLVQGALIVAPASVGAVVGMLYWNYFAPDSSLGLASPKPTSSGVTGEGHKDTQDLSPTLL